MDGIAVCGDCRQLDGSVLVAQFVGRFVGSRLVQSFNGALLLLTALGVSLVGFLLFWLSPLPLLNVVACSLA